MLQQDGRLMEVVLAGLAMQCVKLAVLEQTGNGGLLWR